MGGFGFLFIIIAFAFLYFVMVRPQKRRQLETQRMLNDLKVGDEIVTAGGLYGRIQSVRDDELDLEIAPGTVVRIARRAVPGKIEPEDEEEPADEPEEEPAEAAIPESES